MERKVPRRNRDRILELALRLFNDHGEPNVSTASLAEALEISPGNLYYHFRNKDDIVNSLFGEFDRELESTLSNALAPVERIENVWQCLESLFALFWRYRFLYRDINELLSRNRRLEMRFKRIVEHETAIVRRWLHDLSRNRELLAPDDRLDAIATNMVVVSSFWLSFEFVRDARSFGSGRHIAASSRRGVQQTLALIDAWLSDDARARLAALPHGDSLLPEIAAPLPETVAPIAAAAPNDNAAPDTRLTHAIEPMHAAEQLLGPAHAVSGGQRHEAHTATSPATQDASAAIDPRAH